MKDLIKAIAKLKLHIINHFCQSNSCLLAHRVIAALQCGHVHSRPTSWASNSNFSPQDLHVLVMWRIWSRSIYCLFATHEYAEPVNVNYPMSHLEKPVNLQNYLRRLISDRLRAGRDIESQPFHKLIEAVDLAWSCPRPSEPINCESSQDWFMLPRMVFVSHNWLEPVGVEPHCLRSAPGGVNPLSQRPAEGTGPGSIIK